MGPTTARYLRLRCLSEPQARRSGVTAANRWQIEVTGAGRIWYLVDPESSTVWIDHAGPGHPRATVP